MKYLDECYMMDRDQSLAQVQSILARAAGAPLPWSLKSEDGLTCLHLAAMNESTPPEELGNIVSALLASGAPPTALDDEGDTALKAVMSLAEDADRNGDNEGGEDAEALKLMHVASMRALVQCQAQPVGQAEVNSILSWLRRHVPEVAHPPVLKDLEARAGKTLVGRAWSSEELLGYLEKKAYDERAGVDAGEIRRLIEGGAQPDHKQNGVTALLLVVLNPYSSLPHLQEVFKMMLQAAPGAAAQRDGFKLSPLQWASDYVNIAQQHGLSRPNPAVLLALLPSMVELLPDDVDGGASCLKVAPDGQCFASAPPGAPSLRFFEGERVLCRLCAPGGQMEWEEGCVTGLWYKERIWPSGCFGAYEVSLDIGLKVFALVDNDRIVKREAQVVKSPFKIAAPPVLPASGGGSGGYPQAKAQAAPVAGGKRFQKRQRPDGSWEMLDTVSGKTRPAPDSDSD